jgi:formate-dependent nitrite reductase cytochrome c552 subunit
MHYRNWIGLTLVIFSLALFFRTALAYTVPDISAQSRKCIDCHKKESPSIYEQWGSSKHFRANIGCYECHKAETSDPDAMLHEGLLIATIVSPRDCNRCHEKETGEFITSHHAKGARILGSLDNTLAEVVEGNQAFKTPGFPKGNSAAAVSGCWQCHGSEVKVLKNGKLDPATWPNTGIGRINPDGSEGSCSACHSRHTFSAAQARYPDTCG